MSEVRSTLLRVAHQNPSLRADLVPLVHEAGFMDKLKSLWEGYKKEHPNSKKPPESLVDQAKGKGDGKGVPEKAPEKKETDREVWERGQKEKKEKEEAHKKDRTTKIPGEVDQIHKKMEDLGKLSDDDVMKLMHSVSALGMETNWGAKGSEGTDSLSQLNKKLNEEWHKRRDKKASFRMLTLMAHAHPESRVRLLPILKRLST